MSTPHIHVQNTTVRDVNPEKYLRLRGTSTLSQIPKQSTSRNPLHYGSEDSMRDIHGQIAKHLKAGEQSLLMKYLAETKISPLHIHDGARTYLRAIESLDATALMRPNAKRMKSRFTADADLQSKHSDRILPTHTEAWDMKSKEKTTLRDRISGVSSQGDASVRKDVSKSTPPASKHSPSTSRPDSSKAAAAADLQREKTESESRASDKSQGSRGPKGFVGLTESAKRRYHLYSDMRSRSNMPRLVSSDLSDRRTKANLGKAAKGDEIGEIGLEQALALLEGELNERQVEMDIGARNGLLNGPRLRECVSDAKVTRTGSQGSKRPRSRKPATPPKMRGSRVRNPRSLANFLRAGFHPPEPGKNGRRCVDWGALPGVKPLVENMLNRCMAMTAGPGGDLSPPTTAPKSTLLESQLTITPAVRRTSNVTSLGMLRADGAARGSMHVPALGDPRRSQRRGGGGIGGGGRPDAPDSAASASTPLTRGVHGEQDPGLDPSTSSGSGTNPLDAYFPPEPFVSATNFGQALRNNRKGRGVVKGPPSYRSIPVLRGNLFLTMPSITEESEEKEWEEEAAGEGDGEEDDDDDEEEDEEMEEEKDLMTRKDEDDADEKKAEWLRRSEEERERYEQWNKKRSEEEERRKYVEEERHRRQEQEEERMREREQKRREEQERRKRLEDEEARKLEENLKVIGDYENLEKLMKGRSAEERERRSKEDQEKRRVELEQMERRALERLRRAEAAEGNGGGGGGHGARGKWERVEEKTSEGAGVVAAAAAAVAAGGSKSPGGKYPKRDRERVRREAAAEAERKVAEKVLGRWAQRHVASMQRHSAGSHAATPSTSSGVHHHLHHHHHHRSAGSIADAAPGRKRKGSCAHKKDSRKKEGGSRSSAAEGREPLDKALHDLWKSAKIAAVRQGEKDLLARAANILDTKLVH